MKQTTRSLNLPKPIAAYFAADKGVSEALPQCFTENAVVKDEGHTYQGRPAINQWKIDASTKYQYTSEPFASEEQDGKIVVTSRLTGNFPGSPVNLRYFFELERDKIRSWKSSPEGAERGVIKIRQVLDCACPLALSASSTERIRFRWGESLPSIGPTEEVAREPSCGL